MAFVRNVGNTGDSGASAVGNALSITVGASGAAAGDFLVLGATNKANVNAITSVTDTRGNTWALGRAAAGKTNVRSEVWASLLTTALVSGDTIVLHATGATDAYVAGVDEFNGFTGTGFTVDVSQVLDENTPGTTLDSCGVTTIYASDLIYCVLGSNLQEGISALATGMTTGFTYGAGTGQGNFEYIIRSTKGTNNVADGNPQWTSSGQNISVVVVAFKTDGPTSPGNFGSVRGSFPAGGS